MWESGPAVPDFHFQVSGGGWSLKRLKWLQSTQRTPDSCLLSRIKMWIFQQGCNGYGEGSLAEDQSGTPEF